MSNLIKGALQGIGGVLKFGQGFMGKSTAVVLGLCGVCAVAIWKLQGDAAILIVIGLLSLLIAGWFLSMRQYTAKYPALASLEGAQLLSFWKWQGGTKKEPRPVRAVVVPDPESSPLPPNPPLLIEEDESEPEQPE